MIRTPHRLVTHWGADWDRRGGPAVQRCQLPRKKYLKRYKDTITREMQNPHGVGCPWHSITETWGAPNVKWCEETLCQWISEPANTWSNLAYIFAAILLWKTKTKKPSVRTRLNYFSFAIAFCGIGSFIYHASNNRLTQFLDFLGMFAVAVRFFFYIIRLHLFSQSLTSRTYKSSGLFSLHVLQD